MTDMLSIADLSGFSRDDLEVFLEEISKNEIVRTSGRGFSSWTHNVLMTTIKEMYPVRTPEDDAEALNALRCEKINYYRERAIPEWGTFCDGKLVLKSGTEVDGWSYDRDTQPGSFVRIANQVRADRGIPFV